MTNTEKLNKLNKRMDKVINTIDSLNKLCKRKLIKNVLDDLQELSQNTLPRNTILEYLKQYDSIKPSTAKRLLNCSRSAAVQILKKMVVDGLLEHNGRHDIASAYILAKTKED